MIIPEEQHLAHYGIARKSGRYPWGSGGNLATTMPRNPTLLDDVAAFKAKGYSNTEIAKALGMTTTELVAKKAIASNERKQANIAQAQKLKDKGLSNVEIGKAMGINESSVRGYLAPGVADRAANLTAIANMLKTEVDNGGWIDVGAGVENQLGISEQKLKNAVQMVKEQGYALVPYQIDQVGTQTKTTGKVLAPPGTTYRDVATSKDQIRQVSAFSSDNGRSMVPVLPPLSLDPKRVAIRYAEDGGAQADGVMYVRPGVKDLSIGDNRYAQVRIAVGDSHYLKGMVMFKDDLPPGVDIQFNTNKSNTGNKLDALKKMEIDPQTGQVNKLYPFGSIVRQVGETDADGKYRVTSVMNIMGTKEGSGVEGGWDKWSRSLPSQFLSKQSPVLAKQQLDEAHRRKQAELDEIKALTNPVVRRKLLEEFADGADASSVHMKAAALPRQATQVILPINSLKDSEIYAPNFRPGERVALVRFPHGGTFEIPELTVNNSNREGRKLIGPNAQDAVGINAKVASRLSGADFDGDTVLVIPNGSGAVKSTAALQGLKNFDAQRLYKLPDDAPRMKSKTKQTEMGKVSNLITDMTIKGAGPDELARAVRHSMVVIDAEKHHLDYKRSAKDNGIKALKAKYQGGEQAGSSTIISRAKGQVTVPKAKLRSPKDGGPIDPKTGNFVYQPAETYVDRNGTTVTKTVRSKALAETGDAFTIVGDRTNKVEVTYANHSNRMKQLARDARIEVAAFKPPLINRSAKEAYKDEVTSLNAKLDAARRNKPLERQAQVFANATIAQKKLEKPDMDEADLKKVRTQAIAAARARTGADRQQIVPTPREWEAIQSGAVSYNQLNQILASADMKAVRELATPRTSIAMTSGKTAQAQAMLARGYTQAEVADQLGVSLTTLKNTINA